MSNSVIYAIGPIDLVQATSLVGPRLPLNHIVHVLECHNKVLYNLIPVLFVYMQATLRHQPCVFQVSCWINVGPTYFKVVHSSNLHAVSRFCREEFFRYLRI